MNAWLFLGIGIALFTIALIISKKEKESFDYILIAWLGTNSAYLTYLFFSFEQWTDHKTVLFILNFSPLLTAPLLYFYVKILVGKKSLSMLRESYHVLPYLIMTGLSVITNLTSGEPIRFTNGVILYPTSVPYLLRIYGVVMAFFSFIYPLICIYLIRKHRKRIMHEFSYKETITLSWLNKWISLEMTGFWVAFIIIWAGNFEFINYEFSFSTIGLIIIFNISFIGFFGLKQNIIFSKGDEIEAEKKYQKSTLVKSDISKILKDLKHTMKLEKPFLNPKLNILDLSNKIGVNKYQLSQAINQGLETNFYDFVNTYRVKEFKERVAQTDYRHLSILGIALESGFNSKSSFNLIFKKIEGITPSEFKKRLNHIHI